MNSNKVLCQLCEAKEGEILCESCKRVFIYCSECFRFSHQSDSLSAHKSRAISSENIETLIKNGFLCKEHHEERYTLMCKTCNQPICNECAIRGKHRTHKVIAAKDYFKLLISAKSRKLESVDLPYEDIAKCVAAVEEVYGRRKSFVRRATEVIELLFRGILLDIAKSRQSMLHLFNDFEQMCVRRRDNLITAVNNLMGRDNPTIKTTEDLKEELSSLVKVWRDKCDVVQAEINMLETAALSSNINDLSTINKVVDFTSIRAKYSQVRDRCMRVKQEADQKYPCTCLLIKVSQRLLERSLTSISCRPLWNTVSSLAFSNCLGWHCYVITRRLPKAFNAKLRLNNITSAAGDWTHAVGITDDRSLKQRIRPTDCAVLFNTTHWSFTPNFESARHEFKNNDVITITLTKNKEIHVQVNNELETIPFIDIKGDYYLFCSLYGKQQEIEILDLKEIL